MIFTRRKTRTLLLGLGFLILLFCGAGEVLAQQQFPQIQMPNISINGAPQEDKAKMSTYLQLMFLVLVVYHYLFYFFLKQMLLSNELDY